MLPSKAMASTDQCGVQVFNITASVPRRAWDATLSLDALALELPIRRRRRVADTLMAATPFVMEILGGSCCCVVILTDIEAERVSLDTVSVTM